MEEMEMICFQIISQAGHAKSKLLLALKVAKEQQFEQSLQLVKEAEEAFVNAHHIHASLIQKEASGQAVIMTLLLSHAEDQLLSTETTKEFVLEFINLYQNYQLIKK